MKRSDAAKLTPKAKGKIREGTQGAAPGPAAMPEVPKSTTGQSAKMAETTPKTALRAGASRKIKGLG